MCWSSNSKTLSWLGVMWGLLSLAALLTAFLSNVWLYTKEPIKFSNSDILTTVTFRIGLWKVCYSIKRSDTPANMSNFWCTSIKYSSWEDITSTDIGLSTSLEFTPLFLSRMRISTVFGAVSIILIFLATTYALVGLYNSDNKTILACGFFILGGLTLGGGLLIFASVLSDAYFERPKKTHLISNSPGKITSSGLFDYKYGWSFFVAGAAFIMAELAAVLSISAYVRRFPTLEDMVRVMVPGAERKLKEHHGLSEEYLVQHKNKYPIQTSDISVSLASGIESKCKGDSDKASEFQRNEGEIFLSKPAPDICTSNPAAIETENMSFSSLVPSEILAGTKTTFCRNPTSTFTLEENTAVSPNPVLSNPPFRGSFAGQTVPITLTNSQKSSGLPLTQNNDNIRNFNISSLPLLESSKIHETANVSSLFCEEKFAQNPESSKLSNFEQTFCFNQHEDLLNENYNGRHLNTKVCESGHNVFETFYSEKTFNTLDQSFDIQGTFSSNSSSSGTGSGIGFTMQSGLLKKKNGSSTEKKKKKSVTIGSVFSKLETFGPENECDPFECKSGL